MSRSAKRCRNSSRSAQAADEEDRLLSLSDALMQEADDLYFAMNEASALDNLPLSVHYGHELRDVMNLWHAVEARLNGATVN